MLNLLLIVSEHGACVPVIMFLEDVLIVTNLATVFPKLNDTITLLSSISSSLQLASFFSQGHDLKLTVLSVATTF